MSASIALDSAFTKTSLSRFSALHWDTASLNYNQAWHDPEYGIGARAKSTCFSFRMLRYWYVTQLLMAERVRLGRPLRVLEVGVDRGQMKAFVDGMPRGTSPYSDWDAADVAPQRDALNAAGYGTCMELDLDNSESLVACAATHLGQYDVIILLHILEHLDKPERAVTFLSSALRCGGAMIGGFPVLPSGIARLREWQLRKTSKPFGHVSAFSPRRVRKMAECAGLRSEFAAGAFACRMSGSPLENHRGWLRLNTLFGAIFPGWPGEIYWQLRRPIAAPATHRTMAHANEAISAV
jgi:SAM-dependent methyltransferase